METPQKEIPKTPVKRAVTLKQKKQGDIIIDKTKMDLFLEEYLANNGNGTEAALKVFNTKSRQNAAAIAHIYLKRAQHLGRLQMEKKGMTYGKMLDVAIGKMETSKTPAWWDRLMKLGGYEDFMAKQGPTKTTVNVMGVQKELLDEYVEGELQEDEE